LIIIGVLIFVIIDPYGWVKFSTKRFKSKFKDLAEPPLPNKIQKFDPDDDSRRALLPYNRDCTASENKLRKTLSEFRKRWTQQKASQFQLVLEEDLKHEFC